ncbi:MAG: peptidyl-prolyl cis-trans isomerase [Flammeovirgaceae bacterium]|nr:peptidyl-prolyl cis-trans isomerase [Flammeovirgaceae bacterium]
MNRFLIYLALIVTIPGCEYLKGTGAGLEDETAVARVGDKYLYKNELSGLISGRTTSKDSASIVERYVDTWIRKQLLLKSAEENMDLNEEEILKKIQDYRYQLIVYEYEKEYIQKHLDTAISEAQIQKYYEENVDNFQLKQNIVKGLFLKIPNEAPKIEDLKSWFNSNKPQDVEKITSYAYSFGDSYLLDDSVWLDFDEFLYNTPFNDEITNPIQVLKKGKFLQTSDSLFNYYIKINDYKIIDEASPLEFVRDQVKNILLNRRIVSLKKTQENEIYDKALNSNEYEVYK